MITVFSTIKFFDVSCHAWVDDVTLGFGTIDGQIRLYRETVAMEVVNLKSLQNDLIGDYDPKQSHVIKMFGNDQYLLVYVQIGVIFVFPAGNLKERWKNSKAIILNSVKVDTVCTFLHMDQSNDNILYGDNESISLCNVNYAEAICDNGLRLITAKNSAPIKQICYEHRSKIVAVLDRDGLILVTSMINKRTISHGFFKNAMAIAVLPHGQKLLLADSNTITVYHILFHELLKGETIWEEKVEALVQNQTSDKLAIANSSSLTVLAAEDFSQLFQINLESNQDIITLKWSTNSAYIGIIANKDTIYLIDAVEGKIIWFHEYKLRFFVDIAVDENMIFALGNKFTVARFLDKKELDSMNVHHEGVSFNSTSTTVITTPEAYFYGTKMGTLLKAQAENVENVQQIKMGDIKGISAMIWIASENIILTGHDDGNLMILNLNTENQSLPPKTDYENIVLCRVNTVERNKFLAKEFEVERNLIRKQAKRIFEEYKEKKEKEIKELNETLETNMQAMKEKIKVMENKYEASEAAKEEIIAKLKADFKNEINEQKLFYENMINDQIKASLEKDETNTKSMEKIQKMYKHDFQKLQHEWETKEKEFLKEISKNKTNTEKVRKKLFESESLRKMTIQQISDEEKKFYQTLRSLKQKYEEEQKHFAATIKDLKATILIIENEKGAEVQNVRQQKIRLEALSDELAENQNLFDEKNSLIEKQQEQITKLEKEVEKVNKQVQKLNQKTTIVSKDIEHEKHLRRNAESRLKTFEAMVEAMSVEIYDSRKLEKNALAMLAFFKSPNQLLQRSKSHVITRIKKP
uniref:Uncharacterized protein n=1 Tax=Panagrolaimus sp. ES5 TaxID=591445 RepID=A0AC34FSD0_9BILA